MENVMAQPDTTHKLDAKAEMADLWLLHCEGLQAEVERLKQENDRLSRRSKPLTVERIGVVKVKTQAYVSTLEVVAAEVCGNPRDKKRSYRFGLFLSTMLLLNPGAVSARVAAGGDWAEALELAITALENTPLGDHLRRVLRFRCGNELPLMRN